MGKDLNYVTGSRVKILPFETILENIVKAMINDARPISPLDMVIILQADQWRDRLGQEVGVAEIEDHGFISDKGYPYSDFYIEEVVTND